MEISIRAYRVISKKVFFAFVETQKETQLLGGKEFFIFISNNQFRFTFLSQRYAFWFKVLVLYVMCKLVSSSLTLQSSVIILLLSFFF
jgi:hypothetical protein